MNLKSSRPIKHFLSSRVSNTIFLLRPINFKIGYILGDLVFSENIIYASVWNSIGMGICSKGREEVWKWDNVYSPLLNGNGIINHYIFFYMRLTLLTILIMISTSTAVVRMQERGFLSHLNKFYLYVQFDGVVDRLLLDYRVTLWI